MVIFGAGASHGSRRENSADKRASSDAGHRWFPKPPLTAGLFAEQYGGYATKYPSSRPAIVRLRKALRERPESLIELEIGSLYESASANPERARHLLALRFYLADLVATEASRWWELFHGFTLYADLLERLGAWRNDAREAVVLVTFNYDQLLDRSAEAQVGDWELTSFDSYSNRPDWRLYKLHGSTTWSRVIGVRFEGPVTPNRVIADAPEIDLARGILSPRSGADALGAIVPSERLASLQRRSVSTTVVPAIAVPTNLKQTFECPHDHLQSFIAEIGGVDRLLTIGWRGAEPHAVQLLAEHVRPGYELAICDVGQHEIAAVHASLGLAGARGRGPQMFHGGFEGLLEADDLERWLGRPIM